MSAAVGAVSHVQPARGGGMGDTLPDEPQAPSGEGVVGVVQKIWCDEGATYMFLVGCFFVLLASVRIVL